MLKNKPNIYDSEVYSFQKYPTEAGIAYISYSKLLAGESLAISVLYFDKTKKTYCNKIFRYFLCQF